MSFLRSPRSPRRSSSIEAVRSGVGRDRCAEVHRWHSPAGPPRRTLGRCRGRDIVAACVEYRPGTADRASTLEPVTVVLELNTVSDLLVALRAAGFESSTVHALTWQD